MPPPDHSTDPPEHRGWFRRLADWLTGRTAAFRRQEAEIDRRRRELRERNASGARRTENTPL